MLHQMPGSRQIPARCAFRALLALKLWGIGRPSHISADVLDEGLALFAGLNVIPKQATLTEYSCRVDPRNIPALMDRWHHALQSIDTSLGEGRSFDLDFHTIAYHGDHALREKHFVSKRSRRQRECWPSWYVMPKLSSSPNANVRVCKAEQNDEILRFVERWKERTGRVPAELVFDSRLTTYAHLAILEQWGIKFLTLRRRSARLVEGVLSTPPDQWRTVRLSNVGRIYRTPRVVEQSIRLNHYPKELRQIAITDLGHEKPTLLLTNEMKTSASKIIDRYARRMVIENTIADAIDFFHMDALSAAVPLKVDLDVQLTLMASGLYRLLGKRVRDGYERAKARTIFHDLVRSSANIEITDNEIIVKLRRRAHNPLLIQRGYTEARAPLPWLDNRVLSIQFK